MLLTNTGLPRHYPPCYLLIQVYPVTTRLTHNQVYPFFVGEAAYYEPSKDIAFMLARKETLAVSLPAEVSSK